jgi:hypothetical protein
VKALAYKPCKACQEDTLHIDNQCRICRASQERSDARVRCLPHEPRPLRSEDACPRKQTRSECLGAEQTDTFVEAVTTGTLERGDHTTNETFTVNLDWLRANLTRTPHGLKTKSIFWG